VREQNRVAQWVKSQGGSVTYDWEQDQFTALLFGEGYFQEIEEVDLSGCGVDDISPLASLTNLKRADLRGNKVTDLSLVGGMTKLEWVNLDANRITDIAPLRSLSALRIISAADNHISDITPLAGIKNLSGVFLANNQIRDVSPLRLHALVSVDLRNNPVDEKDLEQLRNAMSPESFFVTDD
jgi:Leucine-rich repeat (LRR) protein